MNIWNFISVIDWKELKQIFLSMKDILTTNVWILTPLDWFGNFNIFFTVNGFLMASFTLLPLKLLAFANWGQKCFPGYVDRDWCIQLFLCIRREGTNICRVFSYHTIKIFETFQFPFIKFCVISNLFKRSHSRYNWHC